MLNRCFACMNSTDNDSCPSCGHDNAKKINTSKLPLLPEGTMIKGRYLVGVSTKHNDESTVYIGYDTIKNIKVNIREFFPTGLCQRDKEGQLSIALGKEIQFKGLMTDFVELSRQLMEIQPNGVITRVIDLLADNGTIYAIYEHTNSITLNSYLRQNGGELSWEEAEPMFMPLLYAVKLLNSNGIIHRGISLDTIEVTSDRELKLKGICTSAVRAINTELTPELYQGYSAPEQYQKCSSHGEWTDVYAISAVLYRVLTGTSPESADLRDPDIPVMDPHNINASVPYPVCRALIKGMEYDKAQRTLYIKDLIGDLFSRPIKPTPVNIHSEPPPTQQKEQKSFKMPVWLIVILIALPIMLVLFFMLYSAILGPSENNDTSSSSEIAISSDMPSSEETPSSKEVISSEPAEEMLVVNNFVGKYYEDIIASETYSKMFEFEKKEEYDESVKAGEIISQEPDEKMVVPVGTKVVLTVSLGQETVLIPPITDGGGNKIPVDDYKKYLVDNGIVVKIEKIDSFEALSGEIDSLSVQEGELIDRKVTNEVIIYVAN